MAMDKHIVADGAAWMGNVGCSVAIIFVNKVLMKPGTGYGFFFATTLCALHYLVCSISIWVTQGLGYVKKVPLPLGDLLLFTFTANLSIVSLNLSLMINTVGFYQIAKLLIIPFVCLVEKFYLGKQFTPQVIGSVLVVVVGVAIVTVSDLSMGDNMGGLFVAALSVVSSGMQQIFCRSMQQKHKLSSHELLSNTAPAQAWSLMLVGPMLDRYVSDAWVFAYQWSMPALLFMVVSCSLAVGVNLSQFACLGRFSAVSFQVLGHSKTILVLLGGWMFLGDNISLKQAGGMVLAVIGMVLYGVYSSMPAAPEKVEVIEKEEAEALLKGEPDRQGSFRTNGIHKEAVV